MVKEKTQGAGVAGPSGLLAIELIKYAVQKVGQTLEEVEPTWDSFSLIFELRPII